MIMGVIPRGSMPIPVVSHGGSVVMTVIIGFGVLMSVHVYVNVVFSGSRDDRWAGCVRSRHDLESQVGRNADDAEYCLSCL